MVLKEAEEKVEWVERQLAEAMEDKESVVAKGMLRPLKSSGL